jgi:hypothetical protein
MNNNSLSDNDSYLYEQEAGSDGLLEPAEKNIGGSSKTHENNDFDSAPTPIPLEFDDAPTPDANTFDQTVAISDARKDLKEITRGDHTEPVDINKLRELTESEAWENLSPNFPSPDALLPQDLTPEHIKAVIDAVSTQKMRAKYVEIRRERDLDLGGPIDLGDLGELRPVGHGGAKMCFALTTPEGKKMAVLVGSHHNNLGPQIPDDPKLFKIINGFGKNTWAYSDLRAYLLLPIEGYDGIMFQEFGGSDNSVDAAKFSNPMKDLGAKIARKRAIKYIETSPKGRFMLEDVSLGELNHTRHYLFNRGALKPPAVIDIQFSEIKS